MRRVIIPDTANPWVCCINGVTYSYTAGSAASVPDEVAFLIERLPQKPEPPRQELLFPADRETELVAEGGLRFRDSGLTAFSSVVNVTQGALNVLDSELLMKDGSNIRMLGTAAALTDVSLSLKDGSCLDLTEGSEIVIAGTGGGLLLDDSATLTLTGDSYLEVGAGATITGLVASTTARGLHYQAAPVADAAGETPTAAEFNALLAALRTAGLLAPLPVHRDAEADV